MFTQCIYVFPVVKSKTVISLYVVNRWVFTVETQCVLCEVGTGYFVYCFDELRFTRAELSLRWLVAGVSPWAHRFEPRTLWRLVKDQVAL